MPGSDPLSQFFGYVSIACWLGAQFPQIFKNIQLQSCEGLSLPFLLNWYLGDCSNLIGCILTNQLPFQTWLASYFVCVDTTLLFQYFYYNFRPARKPSELPIHSHDRAISASRPSIHAERAPSRYRTISAVAANVAAAAALAAQHDEQGLSRRYVRRQRRHTEHLNETPHPLPREEGEEVPSKMMESFHSEGGTGQKRVSWSIERHRPRGASLGRYSLLIAPDVPPVLSPTDTVNLVSREDLDGSEREPAVEAPPSPTLSHRRNSKASRKSASLIFLGVWALFGIGTYSGGGPDRFRFGDMEAIGRVIGTSDTKIPSAILPSDLSHDVHIQSRTSETYVTFDQPMGLDFPPAAVVDNRFLGRVFAWFCTTLYLTSRLPQIWKNYVRKSVEGLSMSLFIFAFLGNVFYVSSILSSPRFYLPPPLSTEYIRESVPYLLGSGGTLTFDITIVTQFFIYRSRPRRRSLIQESLESEETALLSGIHTPYQISDHPPRGRTSHIKATED